MEDDMWPFRRQKEKPEIRANSVTMEKGEAVIDVRGQTCPGLLRRHETIRLLPGPSISLSRVEVVMPPQ
jgi:hypothetical protein